MYGETDGNKIVGGIQRRNHVINGVKRVNKTEMIGEDSCVVGVSSIVEELKWSRDSVMKSQWM